MTATWEIREGDALERLREMPDESVQCCVTSPPYFGLRDYGVEGQIGLESTPDEFVARLVEVFREVRRVLRRDGTLWLNIGDSYASTPPGRNSDTLHRSSGLHGVESERYRQTLMSGNNQKRDTSRLPGIKPKDLIGVPWLLAFALRADGWYLRSDVIWAKPNPMPESVTDRPTSAHEHVFLLAKSARYFYDADAIRESAVSDHPSGNGYARDERETYRNGDGSARGQVAGWADIGGKRNRRNVWEIATQPYPDAHFATFPPKLVEPCILAGSSPQACGECGAPWERVVERTSLRDLAVRHADGDSPKHAARIEMGLRSARSGLGGSNSHNATTPNAPEVKTTGWRPTCEHRDDTGHSVILDPFAGAGTTALVALRHGRSFIGIELSPAYAEMARNRIRDDAPLLNTPAEVAA